MLHELNDEGKQQLLSIINQPNVQLLQNSQQIVRHATFELNTFYIPNNQACKNIGVSHCDCKCPFMEMKNYM